MKFRPYFWVLGLTKRIYFLGGLGVEVILVGEGVVEKGFRRQWFFFNTLWWDDGFYWSLKSAKRLMDTYGDMLNGLQYQSQISRPVPRNLVDLQFYTYIVLCYTIWQDTCWYHHLRNYVGMSKLLTWRISSLSRFPDTIYRCVISYHFHIYMYLYTCIHLCIHLYTYITNNLRKGIWIKGMTWLNGETTTQTWYHFTFSAFLGVPDISWYEEVTSSGGPSSQNPHGIPTCFFSVCMNLLSQVYDCFVWNRHTFRTSHRHWWVPFRLSNRLKIAGTNGNVQLPRVTRTQKSTNWAIHQRPRFWKWSTIKCCKRYCQTEWILLLPSGKLT